MNGTVRVYSLNGHYLKKYTGKIAIKETLNNGIDMTVDGKRVIIMNSMIVIDENDD